MDAHKEKEIDVNMYILNVKNKYITKKAIENILKKYNINHKIKDLNNFQLAMTPTSYIIDSPENVRLLKIINEKGLVPITNAEKNKAIPLQKNSYQRLEFLGDSVIHLILAKYLFTRYFFENEGFMTRLRTKIENDVVLSKFAKLLELQEYILIPHHLEVIGGRENNYKILEDVFEAFIGALFLETDSSIEICTTLFIGLLEKEIDFSSLICNETNYKDTLLQYYHKMRWNDPEYGFAGVEEKDNKKIFKMYVKGNTIKSKNVEWNVIGVGASNSKKKGEQEAAKQALIYLNALKKTEENIVASGDVEVYDVSDLNNMYS